MIKEQTVKLVTERVARFEAADTVTDDLRKEWKRNIIRLYRVFLREPYSTSLSHVS